MMRNPKFTTSDPGELPESQSRPLLPRRELIRAGVIAAAGLTLAPGMLLHPDAAYARGGPFGKPSVDDQKKVGRQAAQQILQKYREVHDDRAVAFANMGAKLVAALPRDDQKWDFSFHVLDSKEINAFALPGGPMFMYTGLYNLLSTLDAMAAVTGHEMTHVRKEHWAKAYQKQQNRNLIVGLGGILFHASSTVQDLAGAVSNVLSLKYSRGEEDEADKGGLENMVAAGFDPEGMIQLFQALQKVSGNGGGTGGDFLSDHPLTSDRIKHTQQRIVDLKNNYNHNLTPLIGSHAADAAAQAPTQAPKVP